MMHATLTKYAGKMQNSITQNIISSITLPFLY